MFLIFVYYTPNKLQPGVLLLDLHIKVFYFSQMSSCHFMNARSQVVQ